MSTVVGKKFMPYKASPPEAFATISSLDLYDLDVRDTRRGGLNDERAVGMFLQATNRRRD